MTRIGRCSSSTVGLTRILVLALVLYNNLVLASPALALRREPLTFTDDESGEYEADRIVSLPGQPAVEFAMFAGYITVNERAGRAHYYFFVEAEDNPEDKPLVFWFNGGQSSCTLASLLHNLIIIIIIIMV